MILTLFFEKEKQKGVFSGRFFLILPSSPFAHPANPNNFFYLKNLFKNFKTNIRYVVVISLFPRLCNPPRQNLISTQLHNIYLLMRDHHLRAYLLYMWWMIHGEIILLRYSIHWRVQWKEAVAVSINLIVYSFHGTSWITPWTVIYRLIVF